MAERRIWKGVEGDVVADLLGTLLFPEEARDVNAVASVPMYGRSWLPANSQTGPW